MPSLNQLVYASGQENVNLFIVKFVLPFVVAASVAIGALGFVLIQFGLLDPFFLIPVIVFAPLLGAAVAFGYLFYQLESKKGDIEDNLPLFVTFLGTIAQKNIKYSNFFMSINNNPFYGEISFEFRKIYNLAINWRLGYAAAARVVASITPSQLFGRFLHRLSNTIEYGEDLGAYLLAEQGTLMADIEIGYQESIYFISTLSELFSALLTSFAFMTIFIVLLPLFIQVELGEILLWLLIGLVIVDVFFIIFGRAVLPRDKLLHEMPEQSPEQEQLFLLLPISAIAAVVFGVAAYFLLPSAPLTLQLAIALTPLLATGWIARNIEARIKNRETSFQSFIRSLGETAENHRGSFEPLLGKMKTYKYEDLNEILDRLHRRVQITGNIFTSWKFFSMESSSRYVYKFGSMFLEAIYSGAGPNQVGTVISQNLNRLLQVRKLRDKTAGGAVGEVYGAFVGIAMSMFITAGLAYFLSSVFSGFDLTNASQLPAFSFMNFAALDVGQVKFFMIIMVFLHAVFSAVFIKILDGGPVQSGFFHMAILAWIMAVIDFGVVNLFEGISAGALNTGATT